MDYMFGTMLYIDGLRKSRGARCCILILFHSLQPNMRFHFITCGTYIQYAKRDTLSVLRTTRISCTRFEQQSLPRIESSTHFLACPCVLVLLCFARFIEQVVFVNGAHELISCVFVLKIFGNFFSELLFFSFHHTHSKYLFGFFHSFICFGLNAHLIFVFERLIFVFFSIFRRYFD